MTSNKNSPNQGQGANEPDNKPAASSDAANVDWMIMTDIRTRMGIPSQSKPQPNNPPAATASQVSSKQPNDDDLEDFEWLRSLDLDKPIERSPAAKSTSNSQDSIDDVGNIDWLIVTDLKTRMDDSDIKARVNPPSQEIATPTPATTLQTPSSINNLLGNTLNDDLDFDLGLDGLEFISESDFEELNSLEFVTSDNAVGSELTSEIDITEGKIQELNQFLDDDFELGEVKSDSDWDEILGGTEEFGTQPSVDLVSNSLDETTNPVPEVARNIEEDVDLHLDLDADIDTISEQLSEYAEYTSEYTDEEDLQQDLVNDLGDLGLPNELPHELPPNELIENLYIDNEFHGIAEVPQDILFGESAYNLAEDFGDQLVQGFGDSQPLEALDLNTSPNAISDDIWLSPTNLESEVPNQTDFVNASFDEAFTNNWEQIAVNTTEDPIDDAIWDAPSSLDNGNISSAAIENAFGSQDDWAIATPVEHLDVAETFDFQIPPTPENSEQSFDEEVGIANDITFEQEESLELQENLELHELLPDIVAEEDSGLAIAPSFEDSDVNTYPLSDDLLNAEISEDLAWSDGLESEIDSELNYELTPEYELASEQELTFETNDDLSWTSGLQVDPENGSDQVWSDELEANEIIVDAEQYPNDDEWSDELEATIDNDAAPTWQEELVESEEYFEPLEITNNELLGLTESEELAGSENFDDNPLLEEFAIADNLIENESIEPEVSAISVDDPLSDWENLGESIADRITDLEFGDNLVNDELLQGRTNLDSQIATEWDAGLSRGSGAVDIGNLEGNLEVILDENFDLATFDEDSFAEEALPNHNYEKIATTLSPNRIPAPSAPDDVSISGFTPPPAIRHIANSLPTTKRFEDDAIATNSDYFSEIDLIEEALANDLLNDVDNVPDNFVSISAALSSPPSPPYSSSSANLSSPPNFAINNNSNSDFLDDFDLESVDHFITDSGFEPSVSISTALTPPIAPIAPITPLTSEISTQEPTSPSIISSPPLPPFLPPLPPMRSPKQAKRTSPPPNNNSNPPLQSPPQTKTRQDDFDSFHAQTNQNANRKSIDSIDESWSDLLDADTVLSGVLRSPSSSDTSGKTPPSLGRSVGQTSQGREQQQKNSPRKDSKRKEVNLPDFNDLGLEIHDDNTDWSGLLDSGDLSDSITSISRHISQEPSRGRNNPVSSLSTGSSETREIPRDRRKPASSFGDATQARMAATPDQIDFNRFTEENYNSYSYEPIEAPPEVAPKPTKTKSTMPTVSLESLWQDYLKIPAIGLGAIAGAFILYSLLNRPVFDLGLRWGVFKDASGKDFTNADFKGVKLDNVDFTKANLTSAKMQDASLVGTNFKEATLDGVNFTNANLSRARLIQASVVWAEFSKAQMNLVDLAGADLTRTNFVGAKMEGVNLKDAKIGAQGTEKATKFSPTTLLAWQIVNEPREGRNLTNQDLSGLNLSFSMLKRANLSNGKLNYTDLTGTDLSGANLSSSQINGANLSGAKLNGLNLTGVVFEKNKLPKTDEETICPDGKKGPCKF